MYFAEWDDRGGDPIALNEEFEAQYNAEEYEPKIAELMRHAHARLKKENSSSARTWDEAVAELNKGDHYLLVLLDHGPGKWQLLGARSSFLQGQRVGPGPGTFRSLAQKSCLYMTSASTKPCSGC